jgi:hypothetical protein
VIHTFRNLLILCSLFFVIAVLPVKAEQRDSGAAEPKLEAAPEQMVPRAWWLAERRKRKRLARYSVRLERQRNVLRAAVRQRSLRSVWFGLLCIHGHEGAWSSATGNGYFGGLQMDDSFQRTYGKPLLDKLGSANRWPAEAQLAVGIVAFYSGRGYGPWPNTGRACGLL